MTEIQHLLVKLSEECSEISKEVSKALIFGLDNKKNESELTNREKIINEFNDLYGIMQMLVDRNVFDGSKLLTPEAINAKKEKVLKYMKLSQDLGLLKVISDNDADPNCPVCRGSGEYSYGGSFGGGVTTKRCDCYIKLKHNGNI